MAKPTVVRVAELRASARGARGFGSTDAAPQSAAVEAPATVAAITSWTVDVGPASDSYAGDAFLERTYRIVAGEAPAAASAQPTLKKFRIRDGVLYKNGRRC
ncbi:hypothetical protein IWQ57_006547, partial [Coemansia nantahalensis]